MMLSLKKWKTRFRHAWGNILLSRGPKAYNLAYFRSCVETDPYDEAYQFGYIRSLVRNGQYANAERALTRLIDVNQSVFTTPKTVATIARARHTLASVYSRQLKMEEAIAQIDLIDQTTAIRVDNHAQTVKCRALLYLDRGNEAKQIFERLLKRDSYSLMHFSTEYLQQLEDLDQPLDQYFENELGIEFSGDRKRVTVDYLLSRMRIDEAKALMEKIPEKNRHTIIQSAKLAFVDGRFTESRKLYFKAWLKGVRKRSLLADALVSYFHEDKENANGVVYRFAKLFSRIVPGQPTKRKLIMIGNDVKAVFNTYEKTEGVTAMRMHLKDRLLSAVSDHNPDLQGKKILVLPLWGIGDEVMIIGLYPKLQEMADSRGFDITLGVEPRLKSLFERSFPDIRFRAVNRRHRGASVNKLSMENLEDERILPDNSLYYAFDHETWHTRNQYDFMLPAPFIVRDLEADIDDISETILHADSERTAFYRQKLSALSDKPKVGISWRSGFTLQNRSQYYTSLDQWEAIFAHSDKVDFVNLQYDNSTEELGQVAERFGVKVIEFPEIDMFNDFEELGALISALDLTIAPCTVTGDFAGALGVPTLYMINAPEGNWRYQKEGNNDIWFKKIEFISPDKYGDTNAMVQNAARRIVDYIN